ncbi:MAG: RES domain-containing protein [Chitinophagaceae bacterium]
MNFPEIPVSKEYDGKTTPEQEAMLKVIQKKELSAGETRILEECVKFYEDAYSFLEQVDLSKITAVEENEIIGFLKTVLNYKIIFQNNITFKTLFRVSLVRDEFLEKGKVRNVKYLSFPPADVIKRIGKYGRANSPNSTCLYCAFNPLVALLETKPTAGDRIIISEWFKEDDEPFVVFPIANNDSVKNEGLEHATKAFRERMQYNHPLFARILDLLFGFLSSQFIKDVPITSEKGYEYLYSSYFSDIVMFDQSKPVDHPVEPIKKYDGVLYPSVASKHRTDNIAIRPDSVGRIRPVSAREYYIAETHYEEVKVDENGSLDDPSLAFTGAMLRESEAFDDWLIIWTDD